jgi:hypothetical protein
MWWWRKVRKANIPEQLRTSFERYGEDVLAHAVAIGAVSAGQGHELIELLQGKKQQIFDWLTERRDIHERREQRLETAEWAILIWVVVGVIADITILMG